MRIIPYIASRFRLLTERCRSATGLGGRDPRTVQSFAWMGAAQFTGLGIRLASNLILTRLLAPADFAVIGTAMAVITMIEWISDTGVQPAVIRHPSGDREDYLNTAWWIGLGRGVLLTLLVLSLSSPLAWFYHQPQLLPVLIGLAVRPLLLALRSPGFPLLRRNLNYRGVFLDEVGQTVIGTVVSISLAVMLLSPMAIAYGTLAGAFASVALSYVVCPVRPRRWSSEAARDLFTFCRQVLPNTLFMALWLNLDKGIGLRLLSPDEMGCYFVAANLAAVFEGISVRGCDVYFSILSRRCAGTEQARMHHDVFATVTRWLMPTLALLTLTAGPFIGLLYDVRYKLAGPLLAVMMIRLMIRIVGQLHFQYLMVTARLHSATRAYFAAIVVQMILIQPLVHLWGVVGLAVSTLVSTAVVTIVQLLLAEQDPQTNSKPLIRTLAWMLIALCFVNWNFHQPATMNTTAAAILHVEQKANYHDKL